MPVLYHSSRSRGLRPLWTIEEMGIDCELVLVPFPPRLKQPEFLQRNSLGTVPLFVDGHVRMIESAAIAEYLAARYGPTDVALGPNDAEHGSYLDFIHFGEATLAMTLNPFVRFSRFEAEKGLQAAGEAYAETFLKRLSYVDAQIARDGYLCAGRFTVADISVCWALMLARIVGLGDRLPSAVSDYLDAQLERPAFKRAQAREQASITVSLTPRVDDASVEA